MAVAKVNVLVVDIRMVHVAHEANAHTGNQ